MCGKRNTTTPDGSAKRRKIEQPSQYSGPTVSNRPTPNPATTLSADQNGNAAPNTNLVAGTGAHQISKLNTGAATIFGTEEHTLKPIRFRNEDEKIAYFQAHRVKSPNLRHSGEFESSEAYLDYLATIRVHCCLCNGDISLDERDINILSASLGKPQDLRCEDCGHGLHWRCFESWARANPKFTFPSLEGGDWEPRIFVSNDTKDIKDVETWISPKTGACGIQISPSLVHADHTCQFIKDGERWTVDGRSKVLRYSVGPQPNPGRWEDANRSRKEKASMAKHATAEADSSASTDSQETIRSTSTEEDPSFERTVSLSRTREQTLQLSQRQPPKESNEPGTVASITKLRPAEEFTTHREYLEYLDSITVTCCLCAASVYAYVDIDEEFVELPEDLRCEACGHGVHGRCFERWVQQHPAFDWTPIKDAEKSDTWFVSRQTSDVESYMPRKSKKLTCGINVTISSKAAHHVCDVAEAAGQVSTEVTTRDLQRSAKPPDFIRTLPPVSDFDSTQAYLGHLSTIAVHCCICKEDVALDERDFRVWKSLSGEPQDLRCEGCGRGLHWRCFENWANYHPKHDWPTFENMTFKQWYVCNETRDKYHLKPPYLECDGIRICPRLKCAIHVCGLEEEDGQVIFAGNRRVLRWEQEPKPTPDFHAEEQRQFHLQKYGDLT